MSNKWKLWLNDKKHFIIVDQFYVLLSILSVIPEFFALINKYSFT